jgi:dienelactone hydrolase
MSTVDSPFRRAVGRSSALLRGRDAVAGFGERSTLDLPAEPAGDTLQDVWCLGTRIPARRRRAGRFVVAAALLSVIVSGWTSARPVPTSPSPTGSAAAVTRPSTTGTSDAQRSDDDLHHHVTLTVTPSRARYDIPFVSSVSGLAPGQRVTLALTTTAADGTVWSSRAQFTAGTSGRFDTHQRPDGGSYHRADPMGLMETLTPGRPGASFVGPSPWTLTESVVEGGHQVASTTITRLLPHALGVEQTHLRPASGGLYGELFEPAAVPSSPQPGVLVFGGSEGGLAYPVITAAALAAHNIPALAIAYFGEPGLPAHLERIPLEYFAAAVTKLASEPGVDPGRIVLWGTSRGSEAALLTAAHHPDTVRAVIAAVPGAEAGPGLPDTSLAAWTLGGRPVVTAQAQDMGQQSATSPAAIPVGRIAGPLLLICGGDDEVWRSCANSAAIQARLKAHGHAPATLLRYPAAGHLVGFSLPYLPSTATSGRTVDGEKLATGGTYQADQAARADEWPRILEFIKGLTG